jgi:predicted 3-demethylubiquinone-9 3-methyltransferase (glyoxalase superfamily)
MSISQKITPFLWFDHQAEAAAQFYTAIFPNSRIIHVTRYAESDHETHQGRAGTAMTVAFELDGQPFTALNGGPVFTFSEAISFQIACQTQDEVDYF